MEHEVVKMVHYGGSSGEMEWSSGGDEGCDDDGDDGDKDGDNDDFYQIAQNFGGDFLNRRHLSSDFRNIEKRCNSRQIFLSPPKVFLETKTFQWNRN